MSSLAQAIQKYESLIDEFSLNPDRNLAAIGDPLLEGVRFHTFDKLPGHLDSRLFIELAEHAVDEIEATLMQARDDYTLLDPILAKLQSVAAAFNAKGKTVVLASWGMSPSEVGWMIRRINSRPVFEEYLLTAGISEADVEVYDTAYEKDLGRAN
jgi:hypothetical protein